MVSLFKVNEKLSSLKSCPAHERATLSIRKHEATLIDYRKILLCQFCVYVV